MSRRLLFVDFLVLFTCIAVHADIKADEEDVDIDNLIRQMHIVSNNETKLLILDKIAENHDDADSTVKYATQELELAQKLGNRECELKAYNYITWGYYYKEEYEKVIKCGRRTIEIAEELQNSNYLSKGYEMIANAYSMMMQGQIAIDYYQKALEIAEKTNDKVRQAYIYMSLGQENADNYLCDEAIRCHNEAIRIADEIGDIELISSANIRLATDYLNKSSKENNPSLILKAEEIIKNIFDSTRDYIDVPFTYGEVFTHKIKEKLTTIEDAQRDKDFFEKMLEKGAESNKSIGNYHQSFICKLTESEIRILFGEYKKAESTLDSLRGTLDMEDYSDSNADNLCTSYIELYEATKDYKKLSEYQKIHINNLLYNNKTDYAAKMGFAMSEIENEKINRERDIENAKREAELETAARWRSIVIALLLVVGALILRGYIRGRKTNKQLNEHNDFLKEQQEEISVQNESLENQKAIIEAQNIHLQSQNDIITKANKDMVDSMNYAQLIQTAAMPSETQMNAIWGDSMTLLRPLKIVSGDFYWTASTAGYRMLALADCTGHGVPGAFLSMLGITILNELSASVTDIGGSAGKMLDKMNAAFRQSLQRKSNNSETMNGIDIALIIIEPNGQRMHYAGAYRPLIRISGQETTKYDANKMSIGSAAPESIFTDNIIECKRGDMFYMFSDGITDQFGYNDKRETKKLGRKTLIRWIEDMAHLPLSTQKIKLDILIDNWRTNIGGAQCEQTDDISIVGIKI